MTDTFEFCTTTPHNEKCVQIGNPNYLNLSLIEARTLENQLIRIHGNPPGNSVFKITSNPHDFGMYHDLVIVFREEDDEEVNYMLKIERGIPNYWDEIAKQELVKANYPLNMEEAE